MIIFPKQVMKCNMRRVDAGLDAAGLLVGIYVWYIPIIITIFDKFIIAEIEIKSQYGQTELVRAEYKYSARHIPLSHYFSRAETAVISPTIPMHRSERNVGYLGYLAVHSPHAREPYQLTDFQVVFFSADALVPVLLIVVRGVGLEGLVRSVRVTGGHHNIASRGQTVATQQHSRRCT